MQITAERRVTSTEQKTIPRVRVPIRTKLTIPYLVLSIILAVAAAYLITQLVVENVEERFDKQLFEAGKISSELMVGYEMQLLETQRSEEHTSELQSRLHLVCRLLLEKKK